MSTEGLIALVGHEGIVRSRYKDPVGVWTIGVGHCSGRRSEPRNVQRDAHDAGGGRLLQKDIAKYEAAVDKAVTIPLKQNEFDALVSFHFNTGAIGKASFVKKLNAGLMLRAKYVSMQVRACSR